MFEFGLSDDIIPKGILLFLRLFPKEHHSSSCSSYLSSVSPRLIYFAIFFLKNRTTELPAFQPATLSSFSKTECRIQKWFMHIKRVYFVVSKLEEHVSSRSSCRFLCSKDQNKLCAQDKNSKRADSG